MNKVLFALITGFIAGLLLAPDKGSVTRKKLTDGLNDLSDKLSDLAGQFIPEESSLSGNEHIVPKMSDGI